VNDELSATTTNFADRARAYCNAIDRMEDVSFGEWLTSVHAALAAVYHAGLLLPDIASISDEEASTEGYSLRLFENLRDYLGEHDVYRMVWDPLDHEDEAILAHLSYDLSDIYQDLIEGLDLIESGAHPADVIWRWRESFRMHWGRHATDAMRVIHGLRYAMWLT
jgi:hypothetical protein